MTIKVPLGIIDEFYIRRSLALSRVNIASGADPNEFVIMKDETASAKSAVAKGARDGQTLEPLQLGGEPVWGITGPQRSAADGARVAAQRRDSARHATGRAGTGQDAAALAAGLMKVEDERKYKKLLIARPVVPMGKDLGYLPGKKKKSCVRGCSRSTIIWNFCSIRKSRAIWTRYWIGLGSIQVEALTYIRGRSIPGQFIIIDEAQNLTKHELKTIVSRVGQGSKIVLMGDPGAN